MIITIENLENKKAKVVQRIQNSKDKYIKHQIEDMNNFLAEQKELESDYQEILSELTKFAEELKLKEEATKEKQ